MKHTKHMLATAIVTALAAPALAVANELNSENSTQPLKTNMSTNKGTDIIERIEVLGDFREQNIQLKPASISILDEQSIERRSANHLEDVFSAAPNVNFASGSSRSRFFQIRGIGIRSEFSNPVSPSVGMIIDDVDFSSIGSGATLYDVQQVEIYRGPQGTRFGANALAGMIYLESNDPSQDTEGKITLGAGNYGHTELGGVVSTGLTDSLAARLSIHNYQSDGFIDNTYLNTDDTNNRDETTIRSKFDWTISDATQLDFSLFHINIDNGYDAFSLDNTRETLSDEPGHDTQITNAISGKLTHSFNDKMTLQVIASHANSNTEYGYDEDWSYVGIAPGWEYSSFDNYIRDRDNVTVETRLLSGNKGKLFNNTTDWVVGFYYSDSGDDLRREYTYLTNDFTSSIDTTKMAMFGQLDTQLTQQWSTEVGLRVETHEDDYQNSDGYAINPDDDMLGGKFVVNYQADDETLYYGSINRGYKVAGFNTNSDLSANERTYDPEYLWNYELGLKRDLPQYDAWYRLAVFYMDRKDVHVKDDKVITNPDNSTQFITVINNADNGYSQGIELDTGILLTDNVDVYASVGYLDAKFENFTTNEGNFIPERDLAHAPSYTFNIGGNYHVSDALFFNIEVEGKDEFYFSDDHNEQSDSYALVHASVNYTVDDWLLKVWARNITDEDYYVRGFGGFGNDPRKEYAEEPYYQYGDPALFGVKVEYQF